MYDIPKRVLIGVMVCFLDGLQQVALHFLFGFVWLKEERNTPNH